MMFTTKRLILRPHNESDLPFMVELNADPEVNRFTGDSAIDDKEARQILDAMNFQYEKYGTSRFIVEIKETGERIGWAGLKYIDEKTADLGYRFAKSHWGKGYATEAAQACMHFAGRMKFELVISEVHKNNTASIKILKKLGFNFYQENDENELWHKRLV